jgi:hypothetical protein
MFCSGGGDVNGDGFDDVIAAGPFGAASIHVFSGFDGSSIDTFSGTGASAGPGGSGFGFSVSGAGDVNGDGVDDVIVGDTFTYSALLYTSIGAFSPGPLGQTPQDRLSLFDINGAVNARGFTLASGLGSGIVIPAVISGLYATSVVTGTLITFSWSGVPLPGVICMFGPANDGIATYPGVGQLDIGTGPVGGNGIPGNLFVFSDFNLTAQSFFHAQFFCGVAGDGLASFLLSPVFLPGFLTRFQCVMNPSGNFHISNAVDLTIL